MQCAERPVACTTIVLAGPPGRAGTGVVAGRLDDAATMLAELLEATALDGGALEVFCELPGGPVVAAGPSAATASRIRRHPPTADLVEALRALQARGQLDPSRDVAWICAGTRVPALWNARLQASLHRDPAMGCVSPLCLDDPLYAPFGPGSSGAQGGAPAETLPAERVAQGYGSAGLDGWLQSQGMPVPVQMPAPLPWCGVLRAATAAELLALRDAAERGTPTIAPEARRGGDWAHALTRSARPPAASLAIVVEPPPRKAPADAAPPLTLLAEDGLAASHPVQLLRRTLAAALAGETVGRAQGQDHAAALARWSAPVRPARLHVAHSWGGGLSHWVAEFCAADPDCEGLVLRSIGRPGAYGQRLALYRWDRPETPLRAWALELPIHATAIAHRQYRDILDEVIDDYGVDSIVVSSLIGHSLDALRSRLPTLGIAHDHYPFCVAIFAHHGGECRSCDARRLRDCMEHNPGHRFFPGVEAGDWLALRQAFVDTVRGQGVTLVAPSRSTADRWRALMPALASARFEVIPHGVSLPPAVPFDPPAEGRLRLVKIGRLSMEKGGELLESILPALGAFADLTLIGCGDEAAARLRGRAGVTAVAAFEPSELPALVARARPHLGLQLSVVPETFSFTLSELWHCGVPVLGFRTGSLAERIREGVDGYLCEAHADALLARLRELDGRRADLLSMRDRLQGQPQRDRAAMLSDYRAVLPPPGRHAPPHRPPARPAATAATAQGEAGAEAAALPAGGMARASRGRVRIGALSVDPEARYADVARAFLAFTRDKAAASPRLPASLRRLFARPRRGQPR